jgi:hypothetical protein
VRAHNARRACRPLTAARDFVLNSKVESNRLAVGAKQVGRTRTEASMLTFNDCLGFCEVTEEEIAAISEHEHCADIVAAEIGYSLLQSEQGVRQLKRFILDDIEHARACGRVAKSVQLEELYRHFDAIHPPH